jgi:hypothetical protein
MYYIYLNTSYKGLTPKYIYKNHGTGRNYIIPSNCSSTLDR